MRDRYGATSRSTNGGGIRAPSSSYAPANMALRARAGYAAGPPYDLVLGDAYAVLPFGNEVVTRDVTGEQLWEALEHSVSAMPGERALRTDRGLQIRVYGERRRGIARPLVELDDGTPIPGRSERDVCAATSTSSTRVVTAT